MTFELQADGIIGIDLLNKLGATIDCASRTVDIFSVKTEPYDEINLKTNHLNTEEKISLCNCVKYKDIFRKPGQYLSHTNTVKHEIPVDPGQTPINKRPYRLPKSQKQVVAEHIAELKSNGIIRESVSPWNAPIVIVSKKSTDGTPKTLSLIHI